LETILNLKRQIAEHEDDVKNDSGNVDIINEMKEAAKKRRPVLSGRSRKSSSVYEKAVKLDKDRINKTDKLLAKYVNEI